MKARQLAYVVELLEKNRAALEDQSRMTAAAIERLTSSETKQGAVDNTAIRVRLIENGGNRTLTARELGVKRERVERVAKSAGIASNHRSGPRIDGARTVERNAVLAALIETGENIKATVRATGVPESTIRSWRSKWRAQGVL